MPAPPSRLMRLLLLVLVLAALALLGRLTGFTDGLTLAEVRERVQAAGALGLLLYVALFAVGELMHVPGMVFVGAGLLAYGRLPGFFASLFAALVSVSVTFFVVRAVGGKALGTIERPFFKKMLARLEARPVTAVAALRLVFWMAPPVNYALALSPVRYRSYLLGSLLGLTPPLLAAALLFDRLFPALAGE